MLTTCPALWVRPPGRRQPSSCSLATQCDLTTSAAAPGQQVWGKGSVVHLLHHQARRTQPVLHSDFVLLGSREVDKFFPCFLGFHAGSAVGPAADQGGRLPCFLGWRGTCEGGLWSSFRPGSGGGGPSSLWGGRWAAAAGSEVQRCLGCPGLLGPASQSPWPSCQGCMFSQEDI